MERRKILIGLLAILFTGGLAVTGHAQFKVGYVDSDRILAEYSEWNKAQEDFQTQYNAWDQEAKDMQQELEELIEEYERQALLLSAEKKKEREASIEAKRQKLDAYTRTVFGPGGEAERKDMTLRKPLLEKINAAIETVAIEGNYDMIFNSSGLAYSKKDYDITDKILAKLDE